MLESQIQKDYIAAMKAKDQAKSGTLSFLRAQLKNHKINNRLEELTDDDILGIVKKQVKQRQESITQFAEAGRDDLKDKEQQELEILKEYLPEEMAEEELTGIVKTVIQEVGASSPKDMGVVMKAVLDKVGQRADGKLVSQLVKKELNS